MRWSVLFLWGCFWSVQVQGQNENPTNVKPCGRLACKAGLLYCEPDGLDGRPWWRCHDNHVSRDFLNRIGRQHGQRATMDTNGHMGPITPHVLNMRANQFQAQQHQIASPWMPYAYRGMLSSAYQPPYQPWTQPSLYSYQLYQQRSPFYNYYQRLYPQYSSLQMNRGVIPQWPLYPGSYIANQRIQYPSLPFEDYFKRTSIAHPTPSSMIKIPILSNDIQVPTSPEQNPQQVQQTNWFPYSSQFNNANGVSPCRQSMLQSYQ